MKRALSWVACLMLLSPAALPADGRTIADGVYTEEQAAAGEDLYRVQCLTCHDERYFRPVLKRWEGQPLELLYTIMNTTMPQGNPGALPLSDYTEILAYILSLNRYPSGDTELDQDALDEITIAPRKR